MIENPVQLFDYADSYPGYVRGALGEVDPISNPSSVQKERYGGVRQCEAGQAFEIRIDATPNSGNYLWCAIGFYDADMVMLARPSAMSKTDATTLTMAATAPAGAVYCRPSARFYDDGVLSFEASGGGSIL